MTFVAGASFFDSATSFAMIRGGHVDIAILGTFQVSATGDLANWTVPGLMVKGMGGTMELVAGTKRVVVLTDHVAKDGSPKLVDACTLPLTGTGVVDRIISDMAVLDVTEHGFMLVRLSPDVTVDDLKDVTGSVIYLDRALATASDRDPSGHVHRALVNQSVRG